MELELKKLTKEFQGFKAVDDITLTMSNGVYGLLGVNGAGKTTLMRMLCTLIKPTSGSILCDGKDIFALDGEYRRILGYLPQEFGFYPEFSVHDYLMYIASIKGMRISIARKRVTELLRQVGLASMSGWKSIYNITNAQEYILIVLGGYLGCLFMQSLTMLVSAKTNSSVIAVIVPFILIFLPSFLSGTSLPLLNKILGLLPDQMLQMNQVVKFFNLYEIGGKVFCAVPILIISYSILLLLIVPVIYFIYRRKEVYN